MPDDELVERASTRRYDPQSGEVYSTRDAMWDAQLAARLEKRKDDEEPVVRRKLKIFHENQAVLRSAYPRMVRIDGLVSRPDLNGAFGVAVAFFPERGRYEVQVPCSAGPGGGVAFTGGEKMAIKPANLALAENEAPRPRVGGDDTEAEEMA